jgi:hypothetical protein
MPNLHPYLKIALHSLLVAGLLSAISFGLMGQVPDLAQGLRHFSYMALLTFALWVGNKLIAERVPISWVEQPLRRLWVSLLLTVAYTVTVAAAVHAVFNWVVWGTSPLRAIRNMDPSFFLSVLVITFLISLFLHGRAFLFHWKNAIVEAERLKQAHLSARFENLKSQVNPHFLFNSLNVLSSLVYKDADLSAQFIQKLAETYRYVLDTREREVVPLATEFEALEAYVFLMQIRFGENLRVEIAAPTHPRAFIPPLTLQMLVENAVKHNIASRRQPLHIRIAARGDGYIVVVNNLQCKSGQASESGGLGLANIQERYRYLSSQPVQIVQGEDEFSVAVPIIVMQPEKLPS